MGIGLIMVCVRTIIVLRRWIAVHAQLGTLNLKEAVTALLATARMVMWRVDKLAFLERSLFLNVQVSLI